MTAIDFNKIPEALRQLDQWVLWRAAERDGKITKLPYQLDGSMAKSNDRATWASFTEVTAAFRPDRDAGIGFMFSADDDFAGIDLDGCRDPQSGQVAEWAREIIVKFDSYAEVSPSQTGIKIFCRGALPFIGGKKTAIKDAPAVCDKTPALECYAEKRYFAVTGWRIKGPAEPQQRQDALEWLKQAFWPDEPKPTPNAPAKDFHSRDAIIERARKYVAKLPAAVSGQGGHPATFHAACVLVCGFELSDADAMELMREFNQRCEPAWSDKELLHKVQDATKQPGARGYLKNAAPANWTRIKIPDYVDPSLSGPQTTTLADAMRGYVQQIRKGGTKLVGTSIAELDYALGGGFEPGEMVIFAARPSHGKSAFALQAVHYWTELGMRCQIISEEMTAMMIGKRALQFASRRPGEHWDMMVNDLDTDIDEYIRTHERCVLTTQCGTAEAACREIRRAVEEHGIKAAVIDYAQLLSSPGVSRYEQVTKTSIALRRIATEMKIVLLVLCQLSRGVEQRKGEFAPVMADLKDTGQLEQDADVITFLCWPYRMDQAEPLNKYQFFTVKNRNRAINQNLVVCRFIPDRQMILEARPNEPFHGQTDSDFVSPFPDGRIGSI